MKNEEYIKNLHEARALFVDAKDFTDVDLLSYYEMVKNIFGFKLENYNICLARLKATLSELYMNRRDILQLMYGLDGKEKKSFKEIANVQGLSSGRISTLYRDAHRRLAGEYKKYTILKKDKVIDFGRLILLAPISAIDSNNFGMTESFVTANGISCVKVFLELSKGQIRELYMKAVLNGAVVDSCAEEQFVSNIVEAQNQILTQASEYGICITNNKF